MKDVETLFEVQYLPHPLQVNKECMKGLLIEQDAGSPALGLQGIVGLHLTQVNWYGIVQEDLFDYIELLDYLFHPSLMVICSRIVF